MDGWVPKINVCGLTFCNSSSRRTDPNQRAEKDSVLGASWNFSFLGLGLASRFFLGVLVDDSVVYASLSGVTDMGLRLCFLEAVIGVQGARELTTTGAEETATAASAMIAVARGFSNRRV